MSYSAENSVLLCFICTFCYRCAEQCFGLQAGLHTGNLLRFAVNDGGLSFVDGRLEKADLQYLGQSNRARTFADSYSKVGNLVLDMLSYLAFVADGTAFLCSENVWKLPEWSDRIEYLIHETSLPLHFIYRGEKENQSSTRCCNKTFTQ